MGDITEKHLNTCPVDTLHFILYRDDGLDILLNGEDELQGMEDHLNNLHPNLTWTLGHGKEGGYLDLWLMLENGKIEWKNFKKTPPVYVGPDSCHDPAVMGSIVKGVGHRLRINSSKAEYFEKSAEETARAFKISGYNYQDTKRKLLEFKDDNPIDLILKEKVTRNKPVKGVKAFYITKYDPRMPHPRQLISNNYHHISNDPVLSNLFPRENLVGGTRRQRNLSEILSPTAHPNGGGNGSGLGDDNGGGGAGGGGGRWNGPYHCPLFKRNGKCDVCSHMTETSTVYSYYFNRKFAIHGRNVHLPASQRNKHRWFVYLCEDTACHLLYVGSTTDVCARWASTKKACLDQNSNNTGLYKHFQSGCPSFNGDLAHLRWTLLDHVDTSTEQLDSAGHVGGAKCRCTECQRLKQQEDKWICRLGTFYGANGLNSRDEVKARSRVNFVG